MLEGPVHKSSVWHVSEDSAMLCTWSHASPRIAVKHFITCCLPFFAYRIHKSNKLRLLIGELETARQSERLTFLKHSCNWKQSNVNLKQWHFCMPVSVSDFKKASLPATAFIRPRGIYVYIEEDILVHTYVLINDSHFSHYCHMPLCAAYVRM